MVIYVDVDDTFVRSHGTKRIPVLAVIRHIRALHDLGTALYCWSSGGADYARASAEEFGLAGCFTAFLPKPDVLLDDQNIVEWRRLRQVHPNECGRWWMNCARQKRILRERNADTRRDGSAL